MTIINKLLHGVHAIPKLGKYSSKIFHGTKGWYDLGHSLVEKFYAHDIKLGQSEKLNMIW